MGALFLSFFLLLTARKSRHRSAETSSSRRMRRQRQPPEVHPCRTGKLWPSQDCVWPGAVLAPFGEDDPGRGPISSAIRVSSWRDLTFPDRPAGLAIRRCLGRSPPGRGTGGNFKPQVRESEQRPYWLRCDHLPPTWNACMRLLWPIYRLWKKFDDRNAKCRLTDARRTEALTTIHTVSCAAAATSVTGILAMVGSGGAVDDAAANQQQTRNAIRWSLVRRCWAQRR